MFWTSKAAYLPLCTLFPCVHIITYRSSANSWIIVKVKSLKMFFFRDFFFCWNVCMISQLSTYACIYFLTCYSVPILAKIASEPKGLSPVFEVFGGVTRHVVIFPTSGKKLLPSSKDHSVLRPNVFSSKRPLENNFTFNLKVLLKSRVSYSAQSS